MMSCVHAYLGQLADLHETLYEF